MRFYGYSIIYFEVGETSSASIVVFLVLFLFTSKVVEVLSLSLIAFFQEIVASGQGRSGSSS